MEEHIVAIWVVTIRNLNPHMLEFIEVAQKSLVSLVMGQGPPLPPPPRPFFILGALSRQQVLRFTSSLLCIATTRLTGRRNLGGDKKKSIEGTQENALKTIKAYESVRLKRIQNTLKTKKR